MNKMYPSRKCLAYLKATARHGAVAVGLPHSDRTISVRFHGYRAQELVFKSKIR